MAEPPIAKSGSGLFRLDVYIAVAILAGVGIALSWHTFIQPAWPPSCLDTKAVDRAIAEMPGNDVYRLKTVGDYRKIFQDPSTDSEIHCWAEAYFNDGGNHGIAYDFIKLASGQVAVRVQIMPGQFGLSVGPRDGKYLKP